MEDQGGTATGTVSSTALVRALGDAETARGRCLAAVAGEDPHARDVFVVTCDDAPGSIVEEWHGHVGSDPASLGIVAVGATMRSASAQSTGEMGPQRNVVRGVEEFDGALSVVADWATATRPTVVYADPSAIAAHADRGQLVSFVDDLAALVDEVDGEAWFGVDPDRTDRATVALLTTLVDEVRDVATDGARIESTRPKQGGSADVSAATDAEAAAIDQSDALALLANDRRRLVVHWLRRADQPVSVAELAERICEHERTGASSGTDSSFERVYADLYHAQLRKLADVGVIAFDADERTATATPAVAALEPYLTLTAATDLGD